MLTYIKNEHRRRLRLIIRPMFRYVTVYACKRDIAFTSSYFVRCVNCSYNNVAKGIRLLDEKQFLFIQEDFKQVRACERYIPLKECLIIFHYESKSRVLAKMFFCL